MYYGELKRFDTANGPGIGSTLFVSGCTLNCKGCFNKNSQNFKYGKEFTKDVEDEFISYLQHPQVTVANLLGGEVMQQDSKVILNLVKRIKNETNVKIWMWTGLLFEDLILMEDKREILQYVDVLVDGPFKEELKSVRIKHRGSENQRIINVNESLTSEKIVECEIYKFI